VINADLIAGIGNPKKRNKMKHYPEIRYYGDYWGLPIMAFNKLDGSNLRFEYSQKRGFYKFGTRKQIIDSNSIPFGFAVNLFLQKF
jgi:hypothetical protein